MRNILGIAVILVVYLLLAKAAYGFDQSVFAFSSSNATVYHEDDARFSDSAEYSIIFTLSALDGDDDDMYVPSSLGLWGDAVHYQSGTPANVLNPIATSVLVRASGGTTITGWYKIPAGQRATLKLSSFFTPYQSGFYRMTLDQIAVATAPSTDAIAFIPLTNDLVSTDFVNLHAVPEPTVGALVVSLILCLRRRARA